MSDTGIVALTIIEAHRSLGQLQKNWSILTELLTPGKTSYASRPMSEEAKRLADESARRERADRTTRPRRRILDEDGNTIRYRTPGEDPACRSSSSYGALAPAPAPLNMAIQVVRADIYAAIRGLCKHIATTELGAEYLGRADEGIDACFRWLSGDVPGPADPAAGQRIDKAYLDAFGVHRWMRHTPRCNTNTLPTKTWNQICDHPHQLTKVARKLCDCDRPWICRCICHRHASTLPTVENDGRVAPADDCVCGVLSCDGAGWIVEPTSADRGQVGALDLVRNQDTANHITEVLSRANWQARNASGDPEQDQVRVDERCPVCRQRSIVGDHTSADMRHWYTKCDNRLCLCTGQACPCLRPERTQILPTTPERRRRHVWSGREWGVILDLAEVGAQTAAA